MTIERLHIKGFRTLCDAVWEPGRLNVLIGPNGSGKSNLLRAMELLRQSAEGKLPDGILRQGGMVPLLWDGQARDIRWTVRLASPGGQAREPVAGPLTYELDLRQLGSSSAYRVEHELLANSLPEAGGQGTAAPKVLERCPEQAVIFDFDQRQLVAHEGSVPDDQTLLSLIAGPFGNRVASGFRDRLGRWRIYHDVHVDQQAPLRQPAVARLETRVVPNGQNMIPVLHTRYTGEREFKRLVDSAMRAAFGSDFEELVFPPAADQRIQLRLRWHSLATEQSAFDLSDGTIRFLLLLAIFGNPEPGEVIALDEPEAGLHPGMLPIVAELVSEASEKAQIILTTHSPELLDAFRDEPLATTVVQCVDGKTQLSRLDEEELRRWLREYRLGVLYRSGELEGLA